MKDDTFPRVAADDVGDIAVLAAPPLAPMAMPKQTLEAPLIAPILARLARALGVRQLGMGR